jgi:hypothetical protein
MPNNLIPNVLKIRADGGTFVVGANFKSSACNDLRCVCRLPEFLILARSNGLGSLTINTSIQARAQLHPLFAGHTYVFVVIPDEVILLPFDDLAAR